MEQLLERHFAGQSTRELAELDGVSHETVAKEIRKLKREHAIQVAGTLMIARKTGEVIWLVVPTHDSDQVQPWMAYLSWLLGELEWIGTRCEVQVQQKPDGIAFGLTEIVTPKEAN